MLKLSLIICLLAANLQAADLTKEKPTIRKAALRNNCKGDNLILLYAIRLAENGRKGLEFGILHPKAQKAIRNEPTRSLDIQAGWCACTIVNQHKRSKIKQVNNAFIESLGNRYCPIGCDNDNGTNKHWIKNVKFWFYKLKG